MTPLFAFGLVLSVIIGVSLGLIGGGGSILTVPILVYFLGIEPHAAVAISLAVVGATSLFGSCMHWRRGNLDLRGGLLFGASGILGAFAGSPLTKLVSPQALLFIFGLMMLVVAVAMLRKKAHPEASRKFEPHTAKAIMAGFGVGMLTGFVGVGGGFLIVPALLLFGGLDMKKAVGTSLFVIFLNCVAGLLGHMGGGFTEYGLTLGVIALSVGGVVAGTAMSQKFAAHRLQKVFAMLVIAVGAVLIAKNFTILV